MHLATNDLLVSADPAQLFYEPVNTAGWSEVCKGLYGILIGYVLIFGSLIASVVLIVVVIGQMALARGQGGAGASFSLLIVGAIVLVLTLLAGYGLIIRNQWRCLRNAPESFGAKWWMFATMLSIVAGPVLGTATSLAGNDTPPGQVRINGKAPLPKTFQEALAESKKAGQNAAPMKIVSSVIGILAQVFFVLFLRSVALSFNISLGARFAEMYLLFTGLLSAGLVYLIVTPEIFLKQPLLLLLLGGGWAVSCIWYLVLIVATCACIHSGLAKLRTQGDRTSPAGEDKPAYSAPNPEASMALLAHLEASNRPAPNAAGIARASVTHGKTVS